MGKQKFYVIFIIVGFWLPLFLSQSALIKTSYLSQPEDIESPNELNELPLLSLNTNSDENVIESSSSETDTMQYDIINGVENCLPNPYQLNIVDTKKTSITPPCDGITPQFSAESVLGTDDRVRITPTTSFPWRTICNLYITFGSNNYIGSGAIIDENHVLTAGHCVYMISEGGWADSITVVPGTDGGSQPYGSTTATMLRTYTGWTLFEDYRHDFAVITLASDIGSSTGWMGRQTADPSNSIYTGNLTTAGYPGDLDGGVNMYFDNDTGYFADEYNHFYYMDTAGGQSGSPVWRFDGANHYILSVHAYGDSTYNFGTRINQNKFDSINNWLNADSSGTDYPDMVDRGEGYAGFNPTLVGPGLSNFDVWCDIENIGTSGTGNFTVSYYASNDTNITENDYLMGTDNISSILPNIYANSSWSGTFSSNVPNGTYYIGWIIDSADEIDEWYENNNIAYLSSYQLTIDSISPINPTICNQINGSTASNKWQNSVNNPAFNWSGASDTISGVAGYYYYLGPLSSGTSLSFTSTPYFDPPLVTSGTNYLRVQTLDNVGNKASWTTIYVFRHDEITPSNPTDCDQLINHTLSNIWQNSVNNPAFNWSGATDNHSGVIGYYYYWGNESSGTSLNYKNSPSFDPNLISSGAYFLRVKTLDSAGNTASWLTIYTFKYDRIAPSNPIECNQLIGTTSSDEWQIIVNDPSFTWSGASDNHSGVAGYYYYWGIDPSGTSLNYTIEPTFDPPSLFHGVYYLRVQTKDNAGNLSPWITLYIFRYEPLSVIIPIGVMGILGVITIVILKKKGIF